MTERIKTEADSGPVVSDAPAQRPVVGTRWLDRFRVDHRCGEGGFAFVTAVQDEQTGQWFAVKMPRSPDSDLDEFRTEMGFWLELEPHPHIVRAFDVLDIDGRPALFLEYIGSHALNTLRARMSGGQPMPMREAMSCATQIAAAMEHAGRRGEVAHLDLKPENLMRTSDGVIKVTDFGLARRVAVVDGHYPRVSEGSWPYVAPERFEGKALDSRADIYAFGVILFEMVTGRLPFPIDFAGNVHDQMKTFHSSGALRKLTGELYYSGTTGVTELAVRQLISHCLQWYPGERPRSFREVCAALNRIAPSVGAAAEGRTLTPDEDVQRASALYCAGKPSDALSLLNGLLVHHPDDMPLWRRIADLLDTLGEIDTAASIRERI